MSARVVNDTATGKFMNSFCISIVPFPEGNGRCQREFIRTLALHAGYVINFAKVSREEMLKASEDSFLCNYKRMQQLFARCIRKRN